MIVRQFPWLRLALVLLLVTLAGVLHGHPGDPKVFDRQPPYSGPGYRRGVAAAGGPPISFPSDGVALHAWLPLAEFGDEIQNGNDCWGYVSPAGREYALFGHSHGTSFVEITDPGNPALVATIPGPVSLWRDIKVYGHHAYAVSEGGGGIQIIDMSGIDGGAVSLVNEVTEGGNTSTHNVYVNEASGFLYRFGGGDDGMRIYDLADPTTPVFVASWPDRYIHDAVVVSYTEGPYQGQEIAFCCSGFNGGWVETGVDILDVTDKSAITLLARYSYPDNAYSHQAWLSEDRHYLYLNDERDEIELGVTTSTKVLDVSDLANPVFVSSFTTGLPSVDHNLYVHGDLIFEANYRSGLRVFDASDPVAPFEIAHFDTYPEDDDDNYNGLWSNYPFFPSGTIIGSDMEKGLFVWRLGDLPLIAQYPLGRPEVIGPHGEDSLTVEIVEQGGAQLLPGSVELHVDVVGAGFTAAPMLEIGDGVFEIAFPFSPCGEVLPYYVTAQSTDGYTLIDPGVVPGVTFEAAVADTVTTTIDDLETDSGWTVGAPDDDATAGVWERVDPVGTLAQSEDDHTATGTLCWVTGGGSPGGPLAASDVDQGKTTLYGPLLDLSAATDAVVSYWRWYSNDLGSSTDDIFVVDISGGGASWINVETIGPEGFESRGGWRFHQFLVGDYLGSTDQGQLRFVASDYFPGSIVEAAVDDITITELTCDDCNGNGIDDVLEILDGLAEDCNGNGFPDECDIALGTSDDGDGDGIPDECQCPDPYIRGDVNGDGAVDVSDAISVLDYLFDAGPAPAPIDAGDINSDGSVNVADVIFVLNFLFAAGATPAAPFPNPGCP